MLVMEDDLIDASGFELGVPSQEEMLKRQCDLLCAELGPPRFATSPQEHRQTDCYALG
jgi:hypothetical protein